MLDDSEQVEGRAGEAVDPRHRYDVTGGDAFQRYNVGLATISRLGA